MPYILNFSDGANFTHPDVGVLPPKTAIEVSEAVAIQLKHNVNVIVFDDLFIAEEEKDMKFEDFVLQYPNDVLLAQKEWDKYKRKKAK